MRRRSLAAFFPERSEERTLKLTGAQKASEALLMALPCRMCYFKTSETDERTTGRRMAQWNQCNGCDHIETIEGCPSLKKSRHSSRFASGGGSAFSNRASAQLSCSVCLETSQMNNHCPFSRSKGYDLRSPVISLCSLLKFFSNLSAIRSFDPIISITSLNLE